jgi:hAT family C-terminal dimerisation region
LRSGSGGGSLKAEKKSFRFASKRNAQRVFFLNIVSVSFFSGIPFSLSYHFSSLKSQENVSQSSLKAEIVSYESLPRAQFDQDIINFWKNRTEYPILKEIALDILAVPVTEVSVERLFSHLNFILDPHRSSLTGEKIEDILFLRMNAKFKN